MIKRTSLMVHSKKIFIVEVQREKLFVQAESSPNTTSAQAFSKMTLFRMTLLWFMYCFCCDNPYNGLMRVILMSIFCIIMVTAILLYVSLLGVILISAILFSVVLLRVVIVLRSVIFLIVILLGVALQSVILLNALLLSVILPCALPLNVIRLNAC